MQGNRSRDTKPELAVRSAVHRRGLRFRVSTRPICFGLAAAERFIEARQWETELAPA